MQKLDRRNPLHKNIYANGTGYVVSKTIKGDRRRFGQFKNIHDAIQHRDRVKANGWQQVPLPDELQKVRDAESYWKHIDRTTNGRQFRINNYRSEYLTTVSSLEEAMWYKEQYVMCAKGEAPRSCEVDLKTGNPYIKNGFDYPVPERLVKAPPNSYYGKGSIIRKNHSFHIMYGGDKQYFCSCRTYEQADYVRRELMKCDWDRSKLQEILDNYPRYYTKLLFFYQYIHIETDSRTGKPTGRYVLVPPVKENDGKLETIKYSRLEDALFDRDFLKEHDWDYELLVELIDDEANPYYDMELPPIPTRRVRNVQERDYHEAELMQVAEIIREGYNQADVCKRVGISTQTLRRWLRRCWNTTYREFEAIVDAGENPLEVLEKVEQIIQPDLSRHMPTNYNGYVSIKRGQYGDRYIISRKKVYYGAYPSEKLARSIAKDLAKADWDKSKLKAIQAKHGFTSMVNSKRWVYPVPNGSWCVRHKDKRKKMINFGTYWDKRIAETVRDMLIEAGWNRDKLYMIQQEAGWCWHIHDLWSNTMFGRVSVEDIAFVEAIGNVVREEYLYEIKRGRYQVRKRIGGEYVSFGTYPLDKAKEVREFLMDNNWDRELLLAIQEIGEI